MIKTFTTNAIQVKTSDENLEVGSQEAERKIDIVKIPDGEWVGGQKKY